MADKNFVVKHGLEVNQNLVFANAITGQVGIATIFPTATLDVKGTTKTVSIVSNNLSSSGISSLSDIIVDGYVSAGNTFGKKGQVLISTGTGVTWSQSNYYKNSEVFTATVGQDTFIFSYTVGSVDVYINGVRLSPNEFQATDGSTIVLTDPCFGGETVEILGYTVSEGSPVKIDVVGNQLIFSVVGVGSTTLTLF